jgi:hypothetical protein
MDFEQKAAQMRKILRGEEQYGSGRPAEQATRFWIANMLPQSVERARGNSTGHLPPKVDVLVSLVGFSPETTVFAYELLQPTWLVAVYSEEAVGSIDLIGEALRDRLPLSHFDHRRCSPVKPTDIYGIVKRAVEEHRHGGADPQVIIDITGGKKVMTASAALAASQLDLPMCYIDSDYDPELRRPVPGSERILIVDNPTKLFGDEEMRTALELFNKGAYATARERFTELSDAVYEPAWARFMRDLSGIYQAWCDLDLLSFPGWVTGLRGRLADPALLVPAAIEMRLADQLTFLERLAVRNDPSSFLLTFYLLGRHYADQQRHDFAAMFFYRTVENVFSERLRRQFRQFSCRHPDYRLLTDAPDDLAATFGAVSSKLHGGAVPALLPHRIGFLDAAILLYALGDDLLPRMDVKGDRGLSHLKRVAEARNESVLAHGLRSVTPEQTGDLQKTAERALRAFWRLHHAPEDVDDRCASLRFLTIQW